MFRNTEILTLYLPILYLLLLINEVLAGVVAFFASNASQGMAGAIPGSYRRRGCCYAILRGTICGVVGWFLNTVASASADRSESPRDRRAHRLRQGIARAGRHIAPALLLC